MSTLLNALYKKWIGLTIPPTTSFEGQSILITGATSGLGLEAAIHYVHLGASTVYITARTASKGIAAVSTIEARTGKKKKGVVKVLELDMDTFSGVVSFVDDLKATINEIDIVILNAGVIRPDFALGREGWEETLQVNLFSTVLLALLLLPWMKTVRPKSGRMQHLDWTGSSSHIGVNIDQPQFREEEIFKYLNEPDHFEGGAGRYAVSKLFMTYAAAEVAKLTTKADGTPTIIVNSMCPGLVHTSLARNYKDKGLMYQILVPVYFGVFAKNSEHGARTFILSSLEGPEKHGEFIKYYGTPEEYAEKVKPLFSEPGGLKLKAQVWSEMLDILDEKVPGTKKIAQESW